MKVGLSIVAATLVLFAMSSCKECKDCTITTTVIENGDTTITVETQEFCNTNLENVEDLKEGNPDAVEVPLSNPDRLITKYYDCK